jgi:CheY-specific phosphatase CheX
MSAINVYREEQITVAQQTIYQFSDSLMLPIEERWQSQLGNIRSEIHFVNDWKGIFLMECTRPFAISLASLMLSLEAGELSEEDIADVMGEILNTIAGNLKCLLPSETELSIPVTSTVSGPGDCDCEHTTGCMEQSEVSLECELGLLKLSLLHCK